MTVGYLFFADVQYDNNSNESTIGIYYFFFIRTRFVVIR